MIKAQSVRQAGRRMAMVGLVAGIGLLGAACDKGTGSAGPDPASTGIPTVEVRGDMAVVPSAAVGAVKSLKGTGKQSTGNFSVAGTWKLVWSADGPIQVKVISGETFEEVKVLNSSAAGEETMSGNCNCYLEVSSAQPYTVTVTDTPN